MLVERFKMSMCILFAVIQLFSVQPDAAAMSKEQFESKCKKRNCEGLTLEEYKEVVVGGVKKDEKKLKPPGVNLLPSERAAEEAAKVFLESIYGREVLERESPLLVFDDGESWMVFGTLPGNSVGGSIFIRLRKKDAAVLKTHQFK